MSDFEGALQDIRPAFGVSTEALEALCPRGIVEIGSRMQESMDTLMSFATRVTSENSTILHETCLIAGASGTGKTALAANVALKSEFAFVRVISSRSLNSLNYAEKGAFIIKTFEDAHCSPCSLVILDGIEHLIDFSEGRSYSMHLQSILFDVLSEHQSFQSGKKHMIIGTTSQVDALQSLPFMAKFRRLISTYTLNSDEIETVLSRNGNFAERKVSHFTPLCKKLVASELGHPPCPSSAFTRIDIP